ncbi:MAG: hypothetical protein AAGF11_02815 [Myxococcota bacterium]
MAAPRQTHSTLVVALVVALAIALGGPVPAVAMRGPLPEPDSFESEGSDEPPDLPASTTEADPTTLSPEELAQRQLQAKIEQAIEHYKEGQRLYSNGRYGEAAVEFERSYAAVPAANTLYAVALAFGRAGKTVEAVRAFERYLELPDCSQWAPDERPIDCTAQRSEAERNLVEHRGRVGELTLKIAEGVELREVRVAGRTVPIDDFPLLMLPGTVDVELFGMGPDDRRTRPAYITAGEVYEVYVAPWKVDVVDEMSNPGGDLGRDDPQRQKRQKRRLKAVFWSGVGLTGASGVVMAVMGSLARYHFQRFDIEKCPPQCYELNDDGTPVTGPDGELVALDRPYPLGHRNAFERYQVVTNALIGVTVGLAVSTALVGVFAFRKREPTPSGRARVRVHVGAPGLLVRW